MKTKKITSAILAIITMMSVFVFTSSSAELVFSDDFSTGYKAVNWIQIPGCDFQWDSAEQCLIGYANAPVLQPNFSSSNEKKWDKFYCSYDFQIRDFDTLEPSDIHYVCLWYRDLFSNNGSDLLGPVYTYMIDIETGMATFRKEHDYTYVDENGIKKNGKINSILGETVISGDAAEGDTAFTIGKNAPWYEIGMRVTDGKIECYLDHKLVFSFESDPDDEKADGFAVNSVDSTVGSEKSPILFMQMNNYIAVDNFEVWDESYVPGESMDIIEPGDATGDNNINIDDVFTILQHIAKWDVALNLDAADVTGDGKITLADVSRLLKYIAKWDVTLG